MSRVRMLNAVSIAMLLVALTGTAESMPGTTALPSDRPGQAPPANLIPPPGWFEQAVPAGTTTLNVVHCVDQNVVWAAGDASSRSPVVRTTDGGTSWRDAVGVNWPVNAHIQAIYALSDQVCLVGTNFGILARTANGGNTWTHVWEGPPLTSVLAIHFFDQQNGWALCNPTGGTFVTLETSDGGQTWARSFPAPPSPGGNGVMDSCGWIDDQVCIFGTTNFEIKRTSNGGGSWGGVTTPIRVSDVALSPTGIGLAGGDNFMLERSTDSGASWLTRTSPDFSIGDFEFVDGTSEVWAHSSSTGNITTSFAHSNDDGLSWTLTTAPTDYHGFDLCFANPNHGWSVGGSTANAGRIFKFQAYQVDMAHTGPPSQIGSTTQVVSFSAEVRNEGVRDDTYDITVGGVPAGWAFSYTTPAGTFSGPSTLDLSAGVTAPIAFDLDSQGNPGMATVTLMASSQAEPLAMASVEFNKLNGAQVLLVDDDGGAAREQNFASALDAEAGLIWGLWDIAWGDVTTADLEAAAGIVIWSAGDAVPTLTEADRTALSGFMDNGGRLFITGQEIAADLTDPNHPNFPQRIIFFINYLHATFSTTFSGSFDLTGTPGDPIGDGLALALETSGPNGQSTPDGIGALAPADIVFTYDNIPWDAAIKWTDNSAKLVYFGFGFEGIVSAANRQEVLHRILEWFGVTTGIDAPSPAASLLTLPQNHPNPFNPSTSIEFGLPEPALVTLRVYTAGGRLVTTLKDDQLEAGYHSVEWTGHDRNGRSLPSGVYVYRLEAGGRSLSRKLVLAR